MTDSVGKGRRLNSFVLHQYIAYRLGLTDETERY